MMEYIDIITGAVIAAFLFALVMFGRSDDRP